MKGIELPCDEHTINRLAEQAGKLAGELAARSDALCEELADLW